MMAGPLFFLVIISRVKLSAIICELHFESVTATCSVCVLTVYF